jgi:hypothetical protein
MSEKKILNATCKCLQVLANFRPPIVDDNGNAVGDISARQPPLHKKDGTPARNIKEFYLCDLFKKIDADDKKANPPPPVPRLAVFLKCLRDGLQCDFAMEPQQLVDCEFPTVGDLLFEIQQDCS